VENSKQEKYHRREDVSLSMRINTLYKASVFHHIFYREINHLYPTVSSVDLKLKSPENLLGFEIQIPENLWQYNDKSPPRNLE